MKLIKIVKHSRNSCSWTPLIYYYEKFSIHLFDNGDILFHNDNDSHASLIECIWNVDDMRYYPHDPSLSSQYDTILYQKHSGIKIAFSKISNSIKNIVDKFI